MDDVHISTGIAGGIWAREITLPTSQSVDQGNDFTIVRISTGLYEITFIDPHPNGDFFPVTATINDNPGADDYQIDIIKY